MVLIVALLGLGAAAPQESASVWDGVFTDEQAKRGEVAYRQECSNCHGPELEGADMTPPLIGGGFTANWNDLSVGDLYERIRTTMPLDKPGTLSRQQNADVDRVHVEGEHVAGGDHRALARPRSVEADQDSIEQAGTKTLGTSVGADTRKRERTIGDEPIGMK